MLRQDHGLPLPEKVPEVRMFGAMSDKPALIMREAEPEARRYYLEATARDNWSGGLSTRHLSNTSGASIG